MIVDQRLLVCPVQWDARLHGAGGDPEGSPVLVHSRLVLAGLCASQVASGVRWGEVRGGRESEK